MLAYLDALIESLSLRDATGAERLLAHPLARILSEPARLEAVAILRSEGDPLAAPLRVMQLRRQTAELLREDPMVADRGARVEQVPATRTGPPTVSRRTGRLVQMELPLSA